MNISESNTVKVTTNTIENTKFYKTLPFVRKKMVRSWENCKSIDHALKVIEAIGFDKWESQVNMSFTNKEIVKELLSS